MQYLHIWLKTFVCLFVYDPFSKPPISLRGHVVPEAKQKMITLPIPRRDADWSTYVLLESDFNIGNYTVLSTKLDSIWLVYLAEVQNNIAQYVFQTNRMARNWR